MPCHGFASVPQMLPEAGSANAARTAAALAKTIAHKYKK